MVFGDYLESEAIMKNMELLNERQRELVSKLCEYFCQKNSGAAKHMLWKLCYKPEYLKELSKELYETIPEDSERLYVNTIREVLRESYMKKNMFFTFGILHKNDSFLMCPDNVATDIIYEKVEEYVETKTIDDIKRLTRLLDSDQINCYFGGIRELGFTGDESTYIADKVVTSNIATLVWKLWNEKIENKQTIKQTAEVIPAPESKVTAISEKANDTIAGKFELTPKEPSAITAEFILKYSVAFKDLFETVKLFENSGLSTEDIKDAINRKEEIMGLIKAASAFSA